MVEDLQNVKSSKKGSLPSPFGEVLATEMGDAGMIDRDGPAALDTPLEDGKGD